MPEELRFNFHGWKRIALYLFVQLYIAVIVVFTLYFYRQAMVASEVKFYMTYYIQSQL